MTDQESKNFDPKSYLEGYLDCTESVGIQGLELHGELKYFFWGIYLIRIDPKNGIWKKIKKKDQIFQNSNYQVMDNIDDEYFLIKDTTIIFPSELYDGHRISIIAISEIFDVKWHHFSKQDKAHHSLKECLKEFEDSNVWIVTQIHPLKLLKAVHDAKLCPELEQFRIIKDSKFEQAVEKKLKTNPKSDSES